MTASSADRAVSFAAAVSLAAACVAYDPAGPSVPPLDGVWQATISIAFENQLDARADTLAAELTLRDTHYRGRFAGSYLIGLETGAFGGIIRPESTLVVDEFGAPPKPIAAVDTLRRLYRWCDFTRLGTGGLTGRVHGDTLTADGQASLPCFYSQYGSEIEIPTTLTIGARAVR
jgi:hypothetical protein